MRFRQLGNTGFNVSIVSFGTWTIGGSDWGYVDDRDSIKAIHRALDLEINLFDTAPIYGNGRAERVLGEALSGHRDKVFIATKCGPWEDDKGTLHVDLSAGAIVRQCEDSLRRLKTDWIDLLQVHWNDPAYPVEETMAALEKLVVSGKIRAVGVSNFDSGELATAIKSGVPVSLQSPYSLLNRDVEKELLPMCADGGIGFLAYEPLCRGLLAGKINSNTKFEPDDIRRHDERFFGAAFAKNLALVEKLRRFADAHGLEPSTAAVAWLCHNPKVTSAICGIRTAAHAAGNAKAADVVMEDEAAAKLDDIFRT